MGLLIVHGRNVLEPAIDILFVIILFSRLNQNIGGLFFSTTVRPQYGQRIGFIFFFIVPLLSEYVYSCLRNSYFHFRERGTAGK